MNSFAWGFKATMGAAVAGGLILLGIAKKAYIGQEEKETAALNVLCKWFGKFYTAGSIVAACGFIEVLDWEGAKK